MYVSHICTYTYISHFQAGKVSQLYLLLFIVDFDLNEVHVKICFEMLNKMGDISIERKT